MNYIYTNTRNKKQYLLQPEIAMGDKLCLIDMRSCEYKFVVSRTLKRGYSKEVTKETVVELRAFTGMRLGLFRASALGGDLAVWTKSGNCLTFDPYTGEQTNAKNFRYANRIGFAYDFTETSLNWVLD